MSVRAITPLLADVMFRACLDASALDAVYRLFNKHAREKASGLSPSQLRPANGDRPRAPTTGPSAMCVPLSLNSVPI